MEKFRVKGDPQNNFDVVRRPAVRSATLFACILMTVSSMVVYLDELRNARVTKVARCTLFDSFCPPDRKPPKTLSFRGGRAARRHA